MHRMESTGIKNEPSSDGEFVYLREGTAAVPWSPSLRQRVRSFVAASPSLLSKRDRKPKQRRKKMNKLTGACKVCFNDEQLLFHHLLHYIVDAGCFIHIVVGFPCPCRAEF